MINENHLKKYCCEDISLIENYAEAVISSEDYDIHHRNEIDMNLTRKELIDKGLYWKRPAAELIFLKRSEHLSLHHKRKIVTQETRDLMSKNRTGKHTKTEWKKGDTAGNKNGRYVWVCPIKYAYLYNIEKLSMDEIAKELNISEHTARNKKKEFGIKTRKKTPWNKKNQ